MGIGLYIGFSPSGCVALTLDSEGQTQLRVMEHTYGVENGITDESMCWLNVRESILC